TLCSLVSHQSKIVCVWRKSRLETCEKTSLLFFNLKLFKRLRSGYVTFDCQNSTHILKALVHRSRIEGQKVSKKSKKKATSNGKSLCLGTSATCAKRFLTASLRQSLIFLRSISFSNTPESN